MFILKLKTNRGILSWKKIVEKSANFYVDCWACVWMRVDVSKCFPVCYKLIEGYVITPWLVNVYVNCVVREVNTSVLGRRVELLLCAEINQL